MKHIKLIFTTLFLATLSLSGCGKNDTLPSNNISEVSLEDKTNVKDTDLTETTTKTTFSVKTITGDEAKELMDSLDAYVLLDVRTEEEFNEGHIPGAILIPDSSIEENAETLLPDKDATIFVYCRSGRRSALAAETLSSMGYTSIYDFGGIIDWNYDIVKE